MTAYASRRRRRPHLFVCVMLLITVTFDTIKRSLRDVIGPDDCPINYVATLAAFLARLRLQKSDISPSKTQSYPRESNFWVISQNGVRPQGDKVTALPRIIMLADIKQPRSSLCDGLSYYLTSLPNMTRRKYPITTLLKPQ